MLYKLENNAYGLIYNGLPTLYFYFFPCCSSYLANPKSAIFATPSCNKILAGLISRCKILSYVKYCTPFVISNIVFKASNPLNRPFLLISDAKSPPVHNSVTI